MNQSVYIDCERTKILNKVVVRTSIRLNRISVEPVMMQLIFDNKMILK